MVPALNPAQAATPPFHRPAPSRPAPPPPLPQGGHLQPHLCQRGRRGAQHGGGARAAGPGGAGGVAAGEGPRRQPGGQAGGVQRRQQQGQGRRPGQESWPPAAQPQGQQVGQGQAALKAGRMLVAPNPVPVRKCSCLPTQFRPFFLSFTACLPRYFHSACFFCSSLPTVQPGLDCGRPLQKRAAQGRPTQGQPAAGKGMQTSWQSAMPAVLIRCTRATCNSSIHLAKP